MSDKLDAACQGAETTLDLETGWLETREGGSLVSTQQIPDVRDKVLGLAARARALEADRDECARLMARGLEREKALEAENAELRADREVLISDPTHTKLHVAERELAAARAVIAEQKAAGARRKASLRSANDSIAAHRAQRDAALALLREVEWKHPGVEPDGDEFFPSCPFCKADAPAPGHDPREGKHFGDCRLAALLEETK